MKSVNKELEELSLKVFGKKYAWRKLTKTGLFMGRDPNGVALRRMPLTAQGAKDYMEKTLAMREEVLNNMEKKNG